MLLLSTTGLLHESEWGYVWPAPVVTAGVLIVVRWRGCAVIRCAREEDLVRSTAVFGGSNLSCASGRFTGAWLTAVFGGIVLDLRDALPAESPKVASTRAAAQPLVVSLLLPDRVSHEASRDVVTALVDEGSRPCGRPRQPDVAIAVA